MHVGVSAGRGSQSRVRVLGVQGARSMSSVGGGLTSCLGSLSLPLSRSLPLWVSPFLMGLVSFLTSPAHPALSAV